MNIPPSRSPHRRQCSSTPDNTDEKISMAAAYVSKLYQDKLGEGSEEYNYTTATKLEKRSPPKRSVSSPPLQRKPLLVNCGTSSPKKKSSILRRSNSNTNPRACLSSSPNKLPPRLLVSKKFPNKKSPSTPPTRRNAPTRSVSSPLTKTKPVMLFPKHSIKKSPSTPPARIHAPTRSVSSPLTKAKPVLLSNKKKATSPTRKKNPGRNDELGIVSCHSRMMTPQTYHHKSSQSHRSHVNGARSSSDSTLPSIDERIQRNQIPDTRLSVSLHSPRSISRGSDKNEDGLLSTSLHTPRTTKPTRRRSVSNRSHKQKKSFSSLQNTKSASTSSSANTQKPKIRKEFELSSAADRRSMSRRRSSSTSSATGSASSTPSLKKKHAKRRESGYTTNRDDDINASDASSSIHLAPGMQGVKAIARHHGNVIATTTTVPKPLQQGGRRRLKRRNS